MCRGEARNRLPPVTSRAFSDSARRAFPDIDADGQQRHPAAPFSRAQRFGAYTPRLRRGDRGGGRRNPRPDSQRRLGDSMGLRLGSFGRPWDGQGHSLRGRHRDACGADRKVVREYSRRGATGLPLLLRDVRGMAGVRARQFGPDR